MKTNKKQMQTTIYKSNENITFNLTGYNSLSDDELNAIFESVFNNSSRLLNMIFESDYLGVYMLDRKVNDNLELNNIKPEITYGDNDKPIKAVINANYFKKEC